jgi:hypothetical protein
LTGSSATPGTKLRLWLHPATHITESTGDPALLDVVGFASLTFLHLTGLKEGFGGDLPRTFPTLVSPGTEKSRIRKMDSVEAQRRFQAIVVIVVLEELIEWV